MAFYYQNKNNKFYPLPLLKNCDFYYQKYLQTLTYIAIMKTNIFLILKGNKIYEGLRNVRNRQNRLDRER